MNEGFCQCGCGEKTRIALKTNACRGYAKGQPTHFLPGHNKRGRKLSPETRAKMSEARRGRQSNNWQGGWHKDPSGYILVWLPRYHPFTAMCNGDGYVRQHRLLMAETLGRPITEEVVHHVNGVRDDNRLENLSLFENQAAHMSHHARLRAAA